MTTDFFVKTHCDRCPNKLDTRIMSWFTEDTICNECFKKERKLKAYMRNAGKNPSDYEGCGYIPTI